MMPVITLRPQPGCDATVEAARAGGLNAHGFPLFAIAPRAWEAPLPDSFDALLLGSANALRHAGPGLAAYRGKPAYAVGAHTARAAQDDGLDVVTSGIGGLQQVLALLRPGHRRLLRLAGETRVPLTPPPGVTIVERVVYASEPTPMPAALAAMLDRPALLLLHSAEAARHFGRECDRLGLARASIAIAALGSRIAAAAGTGWRTCISAQRPDEPALLALARWMCEEPGP